MPKQVQGGAYVVDLFVGAVSRPEEAHGAVDLVYDDVNGVFLKLGRANLPSEDPKFYQVWPSQATYGHTLAQTGRNFSSYTHSRKYASTETEPAGSVSSLVPPFVIFLVTSLRQKDDFSIRRKSWTMRDWRRQGK